MKQEKMIMGKSISILDKDYILLVNELVKRYRRSQIKAAVKVNKEMLGFYVLYSQYIASLPQLVEESEGTMPSIKEIEAKLDNQSNT